jgi:hypothetical protein
MKSGYTIGPEKQGILLMQTYVFFVYKINTLINMYRSFNLSACCKQLICA